MMQKCWPFVAVFLLLVMGYKKMLDPISFTNTCTLCIPGDIIDWDWEILVKIMSEQINTKKYLMCWKCQIIGIVHQTKDTSAQQLFHLYP